MDRLHLAEMICDCHARAAEFGTNLREWVKDSATKRYNMTPQSKAYKELKDIMDILLDSTF